MAQAKPWLLGRNHLEVERASVGEFVESSRYLGLGSSAFPEIISTLEDVFGGGYEEAIISWGIGSGKSFLASVSLCYMVYSLLCLRDPQRSLGMTEGSSIMLLTMAPSARQAERVVFAEFCKLLERGEWFCEWSESSRKLTSEFRLPKGIAVLAGNSSATFPLGYNLLGAVIDEAAFFPVTDHGRQERLEEVYETLRRRVRSRFLDRGLVLLVSSPRTVDDFFERRIARGAGERGVFVSRKPVWEVRPSHEYCGERFTFEGVKIPIEYRRDFELNPQRAWRDFGARPTSAVDAFLPDATLIDRAVEESRQHPFDSTGRLCGWFGPGNTVGRYIHVDLGLTRDACGMAMALCEESAERPGAPSVVVELMYQIKAPPGGEVDLARPRDIILALRNRGFNIAQVSYDGWQSADSRQILSRKGIRTKTVSVDRTVEAYETMKELLLDGRLSIYRYEPFLREAKRLELAGGSKVDHPPGGSKDVADAVAGAVSEAVRHWGGGGVRAQVV